MHCALTTTEFQVCYETGHLSLVGCLLLRQSLAYVSREKIPCLPSHTLGAEAYAHALKEADWKLSREISTQRNGFQ